MTIISVSICLIQDRLHQHLGCELYIQTQYICICSYMRHMVHIFCVRVNILANCHSFLSSSDSAACVDAHAFASLYFTTPNFFSCFPFHVLAGFRMAFLDACDLFPFVN